MTSTTASSLIGTNQGHCTVAEALGFVVIQIKTPFQSVKVAAMKIIEVISQTDIWHVRIQLRQFHITRLRP